MSNTAVAPICKPLKAHYANEAKTSLNTVSPFVSNANSFLLHPQRKANNISAASLQNFVLRELQGSVRPSLSVLFSSRAPKTNI